MEVFGFLIPIFPELLTIVLGLVVVYLVILELEFRQVRAISNRFGDEETTLEKEIKELKGELAEFKAHLTVMAEVLHYQKPLPSEEAALEAARKVAKPAPKPAPPKPSGPSTAAKGTARTGK